MQRAAETSQCIAQIPVQQKSPHRTLLQQKFMILWSMDICWKLVDQWYLRARLNQLGYYPAKTTSQHYKLRFNWKCQWFTFSVDSLQQKSSWKAALACVQSRTDISYGLWYQILAQIPWISLMKMLKLYTSLMQTTVHLHFFQKKIISFAEILKVLLKKNVSSLKLKRGDKRKLAIFNAVDDAVECSAVQ